MSFHKASTFLESAQYAINGIILAFGSQKNLQRMCLISILVIIVSFISQLSYLEGAVIAICLTIAFFAEMINTAIETIIDSSYGDEFSLVAKSVKDVAAGAVLIVSIGDVLVGLLIFLPKFLAML